MQMQYDNSFRLFPKRAVEEGHSLSSAAYNTRPKLGGADTVGDVVFDGPADSLVIIAGAGNVGEGQIRDAGIRAVPR